LFSGFYYKEVSIEDAKKAGKSGGATVEGAAKLLAKVVGDATKYVGTLNLPDYKAKPDDFSRAAQMCLDKTGGVVIFDLIYLQEFNWWDKIAALKKSDARAKTKLSNSKAVHN